MPIETNYLETVVGVQPRPPVQSLSSTPTAHRIEDSAPAPLSYPGSPHRELGEEISPDLLAELQQYIQQTVSATVTEGIKTLIPEVIELTLAQARQSHPPSAALSASLPTAQSQPVATRSAALASRPAAKADYAETPVPTLHTTNQSYGKAAPLSLVAAWASVFGIVAVMAGVVAYVTTQSPQASTERVVTEQSSQIAKQGELIENLAKEAAKPKNCRAFCF